MRRLFFVFILFGSLAFAKNIYTSYYYFKHNQVKYLSKQAFLYKMGNLKSKVGYYSYLQALSDKYFDTPFDKLIPLNLPNAKTTNKEFVRLPSYSDVVSSYLGVKQKANNIAMSKRYQCSELVNRFYRKIFDINIVQRNGIVTAKEYNKLVGMYDGRPIKIKYYQVTHSNLKVKPRASFALSKVYDIYRVGNDYIYDKFFNNTFKNNPPIDGSILSFANNFHSKYGIYFGHTAIVKKVVKIKNGYRLYCFEQNVIKAKSDTISLNRYITFVHKNGHWQEIGSGILGHKIGRIGPVVGWSNPYFVKHVHIISKPNFYTLMTRLLKSKYFQIIKKQTILLKSIKQDTSAKVYVTKLLYNKVVQKIVSYQSKENKGFFHKLLQKL